MLSWPKVSVSISAIMLELFRCAFSGTLRNSYLVRFMESIRAPFVCRRDVILS